MRNIETAIFPLLLVLCLFKLCVFEYPRGRPRLYFTIFYILTSWLLYIYSIVKTKIFIESFDAVFPPIVYISIIIGSMFILVNIYYHKRFKDCLKKLDVVNDTLEQLGKLKNYAQLRARTIRILVGWAVSVFLMDSVDYLWLSTLVPKHYVAQCICLPYIINHTIHICTLYEVTFIMLLRYTGTLFEHVNQCIEKLLKQKKRRKRLAWTTSASSPSSVHRHLTGSSKQLIYVLMHVHFELSSISHEINIIFGLQMLMQVAWFHLSAIHYILELYYYSILINIHFTYDIAILIFCTCAWVVRCILGLILFNYICEEVCARANRTETFLNSLADVTFDVETQDIIMQFLLETLRKPLRITGLGFYDYGYKLLHKITERAVKMIIIVIQARAQ